MVNILSTLFYFILFTGVFILLFKRKGSGCLFIIVSLILFNVFVPDGYDTNIIDNDKIKNKAVDTSHIDNVENNQSSDLPQTPSNEIQSFKTNSNVNEYERDYNYDYDRDYDDDYYDDNNNYYKRSNEKKTINYQNIIEVDYNVRIGAICNDGSISNATGSGACSHHGGVSEWLYE